MLALKQVAGQNGQGLAENIWKCTSKKKCCFVGWKFNHKKKYIFEVYLSCKFEQKCHNLYAAVGKMCLCYGKKQGSCTMMLLICLINQKEREDEENSLSDVGWCCCWVVCAKCCASFENQSGITLSSVKCLHWIYTLTRETVDHVSALVFLRICGWICLCFFVSTDRHTLFCCAQRTSFAV